MTRFSPFILIPLLSLAGCWPLKQQSPPVADLDLVAVYTVDMPTPLEPSGLTQYNGELFTVADKDENTIYRVVIDSNVARLVPHIRFTPPNPYRMDWEGISSDPAGNFYLISEEQGRILQVRPDGDCDWATPDLMRLTAASGLFAKPNAGFEGIAWMGPNHWLGAVEREPRGLVEFKSLHGSPEIYSSLNEHSPYSNALPILRLPDYSGLDTDAGHIYAIFRAAHLIVRLERHENSLQESQAWNYRHIETDPQWAYISQTYGQAEGLVVDGVDVFMIFDNNLGGRQSDPNDGRPMLVHARMPASF